MVKRSLDEIGKFLDGISKKQNCFFILSESFYADGHRIVEISTIYTLSKVIRNQIKKFLDISTILKKKYDDEGMLMDEGKIENYEENTDLQLVFYNAYRCKLIRKEKKIVKTKKVIGPAITELIEEEKEIPVYECPDGKIIKYD